MNEATICKYKGDIKTLEEFDALSIFKEGVFEETAFIESCVEQIKNKALKTLIRSGQWGTYAEVEYDRDTQRYWLMNPLDDQPIDVTEALVSEIEDVWSVDDMTLFYSGLVIIEDSRGKEAMEPVEDVIQDVLSVNLWGFTGGVLLGTDVDFESRRDRVRDSLRRQ